MEGFFIFSLNLKKAEFVDSLLKKHKEFKLFKYISVEIIHNIKCGELIINYYCLN